MIPVVLPAALLLAGCTDGPPPTPEPVDPDDALREAAAGRERALLAAYDATLTAHPSLAVRLTPLRAHHAEHLAALTGPLPSSASPSVSPSAPPATAAPATPAAALQSLAAAERAAGAAHAQDCLAASRPLAAVLASLSASELSHPVALA